MFVTFRPSVYRKQNVASGACALIYYISRQRRRVRTSRRLAVSIRLKQADTGRAGAQSPAGGRGSSQAGSGCDLVGTKSILTPACRTGVLDREREAAAASSRRMDLCADADSGAPAARALRLFYKKQPFAQSRFWSSVVVV